MDKRLTPPAMALMAMTLAAAGYQGWGERRWSQDTSRGNPAYLANVPERFGDWELESTGAIDAATQKMLGCSDYLNRIYRHRITDDRVQVAVLAGRAGPISVHTPEVCYTSRDYQAVAAPHRVQIRPGERADEALWEATFQRNGSEGGVLRVVYGWTAGDFWKAPSQPRFAFGGEPLIYKLQLAMVTPLGGEAGPTDACRDFLSEFLPLLDRTVSAGPET